MPSWILDLLKQNISEILAPLWGNLAFWRGLSLFFLGVIIAAILKKEWLIHFLISPETREHDRSIFQRADAIMSEDDLKRMLEQLDIDHSYLQSQRRKMTDFISFFEHVGNWYIRGNMAKSTKKLIKSLERFMEFKSAHFFISNQSRSDDPYLVLEPALNIDREGTGSPDETQRYGQYVRVLEDIVDDIRAAYKEYRLNAKKDLGL